MFIPCRRHREHHSADERVAEGLDHQHDEHTDKLARHPDRALVGCPGSLQEVGFFVRSTTGGPRLGRREA
jgi:hypothetical protein